MNYIDIILGIFFLLAAINGIRKGFISEVASLAALILGIWGAIEFSDITQNFLINNLNLQIGHLDIISFIVTFIIIVILVHIIGNSVSKLIEAASLGFINRLAGLVFGILRTALILSVLLLVFDKIDREKEIISPEKKTESYLYEPVRNFAPSIFPFINNWIQNDKKKDTSPKRPKQV